jgi:hypothetical protein
MMTLLCFDRLWEALLGLGEDEEGVLTRDEEDSDGIAGSEDGLDSITADSGSEEISGIAIGLNSSETLLLAYSFID